MAVYIQLPDKLRKLGGDITADEIEQALGYTPADKEDVDNIHDAESGEYYITDKDGNIILKIDADGVHTTEVELGDTSEDKVKVKEFIKNFSAATEKSVADHVNDTNIHITSAERTNWNSKSYLPNIEDDGSGEYNITDPDGNIIFKVDKDGIHSTELTIPKGKLSELIEAASTTLSAEVTRATEAEEALAGDIETVESIAKGANQAVSFDDYETMIAALNSLGNSKYLVGQNIMIVTLDVPDLWVSEIAESSVAYTFVDDDTFATALKTDGSVQVGYYVLSQLETQKVDLTDYAKNTDLSSHTSNKNNPHGVTASQLGLGNVDNTSDADKPVSEAQQTALDNLKKSMSEQIVSESEEWHIVDEAGNIVATIDADGVHSVGFFANGEDIVAKIANIIDGTQKVGSATKATQDGDGNVITETYATKSDVGDIENKSAELLEYELSEDGDSYICTGFKDGLTADDIFVDVVIPSEYDGLPVTSIANNAFYGQYIKSATLPSTITSIGYWAFGANEPMKYVYVPESVTYVGNSAFTYSSNLIIYCEATEQPADWDSTWNGSNRPVVWGASAPNVGESAYSYHATEADLSTMATNLEANRQTVALSSGVCTVTLTAKKLYAIYLSSKCETMLLYYPEASTSLTFYSTTSARGYYCTYKNGTLTVYDETDAAYSTSGYLYIREI